MQSQEALRTAILSGAPLQGLNIIDAHNHLGCWSNFRVAQEGTIDSMLARCDRLGIGRLTLTAHAAIGPDMHLGNDQVQDALQRFPQRAMGYVTIKPCEAQEMLRELETRLALPGFVGIKLHPDLHGRQVADPIYAPALDYADAHRLPVLIHTWGGRNVYDMKTLAQAYPNASFIMAHLGGSPDALEAALEALAQHDNLYGDTALSSSPMGNIRTVVDRVGCEKLLFGTDMPFYDPCFTLARVVTSGLPAHALEQILGGNFSRLLALRRPAAASTCGIAGETPPWRA